MEETRPFTAASFNQYLNERKLMGVRCSACGQLYLPPRAICPRCHSDDMAWTELSGQGRLATFTAIYIAPTLMLDEGYDRDRPYCTGIVETQEGVKISARILGVDPSDTASIQIGAPLAVTFVPHGEDERARLVLAFRVQGWPGGTPRKQGRVMPKKVGDNY